jgi:cyanate permease
VIQFGLACGPVLIGLLRDHFGDYGPALACAAVVDFVALCIVLSGRKPD